MDYRTHDDAALLELVRQRDEDAFNELHRRYHNDTRRLIALFSNVHPNDVEDIHQFFWMQLLRYNQGYDPSKPFRNWILARAARAAARYYRESYAKKRGGGNRIGSIDSVGSHQHGLSTEETPDRKITRQEDKHEVREALATLPGSQREVLQSVYFDGESVYTFANRHRISVGTAKSRLSRGLKKLRQKLT